jgi:regulator of protease activity HflC (stomatin/prohibitin superfamily)
MEIIQLGFIFLAFLGIALIVVAAKTIKIVPQSCVLLIERLGTISSRRRQRLEYI